MLKQICHNILFLLFISLPNVSGYNSYETDIIITVTNFGIKNDGSEKATIQPLNMARSLEKDSLLLPKSFENGKLITSDSHWWCSGFLFEYCANPDTDSFFTPIHGRTRYKWEFYP